MITSRGGVGGVGGVGGGKGWGEFYSEISYKVIQLKIAYVQFYI